MTDTTNSRDARIRSLEAAARRAYGEDADARYWNVEVRLSWSYAVGEITALKHVDLWACDLRARIPGTALIIGLHKDSSLIHAHGRIYLPQRLFSEPTLPVTGSFWSPFVETALQWPHGQVWVEPFSRRKARPHTHGGAEYLAKFPETVMQFGEAPVYRARRKRHG